MKKNILITIGTVCSLIATYYLFTAISGTISLTFKDFNENEKARLGVLLAVNYSIVLLFGIIGFLSLKKGIKS